MTTVIPHWLSKQACLSPDRIAIETVEGNTLTFLELQRESEKTARKLAAAGVRTGDYIGVLSSNQPEMIILIHALSYLGAVVVLLNKRLSTTETLYQLNDAQVSKVFISDDLYPTFQSIEENIELIQFSKIKKFSEQDARLKTEIHLKDPFTMMYTSGTTGKPKGVIHTYGNHWWSAIGSALNLGNHKTDKWLSVLPIFHIGGLAIFLRSVIYGNPVLMMEKYSPSLANRLIQERDITMMSVVTVMLQEMMADLREDSFPNKFRCMLLGGGSAPRSLLKKAKKLNIPLFQSYGLTETTSQFATLSPDDTFTKMGSSGKILFPGQLKINRTTDEKSGEIYVKGPMVIDRYYNIDEQSKYFKNNWLATGDIGYLDDEGYLYVIDRRSDLIISGGENIYPAEIENTLMGMEEIYEVGVVGKEDERWGQVPVAFVVKAQENLSKEDILTYAKKHLASYKVPRKIFFIDQLPRNATKKLQRHLLVELLKQKEKDR